MAAAGPASRDGPQRRTASTPPTAQPSMSVSTDDPRVDPDHRHDDGARGRREGHHAQVLPGGDRHRPADLRLGGPGRAAAGGPSGAGQGPRRPDRAQPAAADHARRRRDGGRAAGGRDGRRAGLHGEAGRGAPPGLSRRRARDGARHRRVDGAEEAAARPEHRSRGHHHQPARRRELRLRRRCLVRGHGAGRAGGRPLRDAGLDLELGRPAGHGHRLLPRAQRRHPHHHRSRDRLAWQDGPGLRHGHRRSASRPGEDHRLVGPSRPHRRVHRELPERLRRHHRLPCRGRGRQRVRAEQHARLRAERLRRPGRDR